MTLLITLIIAAITYGTPLLFGTLGEILTEKSGNLNLGVEGIMFMGGALGLGGVYYYEKLSSSPNGFVAILVGIFFAFLAGAIASLIFSFLTITLRANQNVTGLALSIFGTGIGQFIGEYMRVSENGYISVRNMLKGYFQHSLPQGPAGHSGGRRHPLRQQLLLLPRRCLRRRAVLVPQQDPQRPVPAQRGREPRDRGRRRHQRHAL